MIARYTLNDRNVFIERGNFLQAVQKKNFELIQAYNKFTNHVNTKQSNVA